MTRNQANKPARYLGNVVGKAHARQMTHADRQASKKTLREHRSASLDAPPWM